MIKQAYYKGLPKAAAWSWRNNPIRNGLQRAVAPVVDRIYARTDLGKAQQNILAGNQVSVQQQKAIDKHRSNPTASAAAALGKVTYDAVKPVAEKMVAPIVNRSTMQYDKLSGQLAQGGHLSSDTAALLEMLKRSPTSTAWLNLAAPSTLINTVTNTAIQKRYQDAMMRAHSLTDAKQRHKAVQQAAALLGQLRTVPDWAKYIPYAVRHPVAAWTRMQGETPVGPQFNPETVSAFASLLTPTPDSLKDTTRQNFAEELMYAHKDIIQKKHPLTNLTKLPSQINPFMASFLFSNPDPRSKGILPNIKQDTVSEFARKYNEAYNLLQPVSRFNRWRTGREKLPEGQPFVTVTNLPGYSSTAQSLYSIFGGDPKLHPSQWAMRDRIAQQMPGLVFGNSAQTDNLAGMVQYWANPKTHKTLDQTLKRLKNTVTDVTNGLGPKMMSLIEAMSTNRNM